MVSEPTGNDGQPRPTAAIACVIVSMIAIAVATLTPGTTGTAAPVTCMVCDDFAATDAIANVVLFLPLGVGLAWSNKRASTAILLALVFSGTIEVLQYFVIPGRDPSLRDVLTNVAGCALGWAVVGFLGRARRSTGRSASGIAAGAFVAWLAIQIIGTAAEQLSLPRADYWGQWAPDLGDFRRFAGTLIDARLDGATMPSGRAADSERLRSEFADRGIAVQAAAISDGPIPGLSPIVSMYDARQRQIFLLGEDGRGVVFRVRRKADAWKMRSPSTVLRVPLVEGARVDYRAAYTRGRLRIDAAAPAPPRSLSVALGAWLLWTHLAPFGVEIGTETLWVSAIWCVFLTMPVGLAFGRLSVSVATALAAAAAATLFGDAIVPAVMQMPVAPPLVWLATIAGFSGGWWFASARR